MLPKEWGASYYCLVAVFLFGCAMLGWGFVEMLMFLARHLNIYWS